MNVHKRVMKQQPKPKHQHFIPVSYLNNFAEQSYQKAFILDAKQKGQDKIKPVGTRDICVKKDIYTLKNNKTGNPYHLEEFYAKNVDSIYPKIYKLLTEPRATVIDKKTRERIIYTLTCLYFRTPKVLNAINTFIDDLLDRSVAYTPVDNDKVLIDFEGTKIEFNKNEIENEKKRHREENRLTFLQTQFAKWHEFAQYKLNSGILVTKIVGDIDLITSDNPVSIRSVYGNQFQLFDPSNILHIPIDRKHIVSIIPNGFEAITDTISRKEENYLYALTSNSTVESSCENWIFGYPGTISKHIAEQVKFNAETEENIKIVEASGLKASLLAELTQSIEHFGWPSTQTLNKLNEIKGLDIFQNDSTLDEMIHGLNMVLVNGKSINRN